MQQLPFLLCECCSKPSLLTCILLCCGQGELSRRAEGQVATSQRV